MTKVYLTKDEAWNGEWQCPTCGESYIFSYVVSCYGGCGEEFEVVVSQQG